ncbi:MAG: TlpA family protein disulfide reductase [Deltaproteobacteria bacterium]|nr:TlpA family protein disulfide reductase [Deltaproteobacteria bacterium]MBZ0218946.1 TlpA family protein disulfide reductase [Deltaproteobacteria bacterium]
MSVKTNAEENEKGLPAIALAGIILAVVAAVALIFIFGQRQKFEPVVANAEMIDFELTDLSGKTHKLSDYKGKVIFLNFWATWCKPCEEEMPSMQALSDNLSSFPFVIVAVSVDNDSPENVGKFVEKHGLTFPVLHDRKGKVKETYKTTGVPETFIIDQNGVIAEKVSGPRDWTEPAASRVLMDLVQFGPKEKGGYSAR